MAWHFFILLMGNVTSRLANPSYGIGGGDNRRILSHGTPTLFLRSLSYWSLNQSHSLSAPQCKNTVKASLLALILKEMRYIIIWITASRVTLSERLKQVSGRNVVPCLSYLRTKSFGVNLKVGAVKSRYLRRLILVATAYIILKRTPTTLEPLRHNNLTNRT